MKIIEATEGVHDAKIAIIASRYNNYIVDRLEKGCIKTLTAGGINESNITLVRVPGAFEIPAAASRLADKNEYDAIISLGAVIRGETPHFDYICNECANGLASLSMKVNMPIIFGVLTVENIQQAEDRSGDEESNKGSESASTALEMIEVLRKIG